MEIKAVSSFAVTRSAAPSVQAPEPQAQAGEGRGESPKTQAGIYISPVVRYDQAAKLAVLFFRDADTGETRDQIPAEKVVEEYRRAGGRSAGDTTSSENSAGYERLSTDSGADTGGTATASTTAVGTSAAGSGGPGTGGGYSGGYAGASGTAVSAGFAASGGASGGARVSVTV